MTIAILLATLFLQSTLALPVGPEKINIPEVNISTPLEINNLNYPTSYKQQRSTNDVPQKVDLLDRAVERVDSILRHNSSLPRLTRGEIVEIIENITQSESGTRNRADDKRALMLVMPYTASNSDKSKMEELYTRPPVTHIIGDEEEHKPHRRRRPTLPPMPITKHKTQETTTTPEIVTKITIEESTKSFKKSDSKAKNSKGQNNPVRKRRPIKPTQKHQNHKYPGDDKTPSVINLETSKPPGPNFFTNQGLKLIEAPKLDNPSTHLPPPQISKQPFVNPTTFRPFFEPTPAHLIHKEPPRFINDLSIPDDLKFALESLDLDVSTTTTTAKPQLQIQDLISAMKHLRTTSTTTTTSLPDISNIADTLTPEMKELLMTFGLLPDPNSPPPSSFTQALPPNPNPADIEPDSYIQFKPLPDDGQAREEMDQFLARFGLGRNSRNADVKKFTTTEKAELHDFNIEMLPENMRDVLTDIGFTDRQGKKIRSEMLTKTLEKSTDPVTTEKQHIFNPTDPTYATNEELAKLNQLLDVIKQLDKLNRSATEEEIKQKVNLDEIKKLVDSISQDQFVPLDQDEGPNPLNFDYNSDKNNVKRQENSSTEAPTTTAAATESTESVNESTESSTPNLKALEESFGGVSAEQVTQTIPPPTSSTVRTGFYYLLDWNTFLDIDDQKGRRVNLRFQPKVGDPKRFLAVSVP